jgi:hypothetical protein
MSKREAQQAMKQLARHGWKPNGLVKWQTGGWSISVIGKDGWPIYLDTLESVDSRLTEMAFDGID